MQLLWKAIWQFLEASDMELPFDPAVPSIYPREIKTQTQKKKKKRHNHTKVCAGMYIEAFFIIAKKRG